MRFLAFFLLISVSAFCQVVPQQFRSDWYKAGIEGGFMEPSNVMDVTLFGAVPGDGLPDDAGLAAAVNAAGGAAVVYFPAGLYNFSSPILMSDSIVIRGAGADSTLFEFNLSNAQLNCINFMGSADAVFAPLAGGFQAHSGFVLVNGADSVYTAGDYIEIRQLNGSWDTNPAFWAQYAVGHLSRIERVNADTLFLADSLRIDFNPSLQPQVHKIYPVRNAGVECLRLTRTDSLAPGINYGIYFYFAWNCRVRGIESYKSIGAHIIAEISSHCEIRDSYFHEAYTYDGNNTRGYGVIMSVHATSFLTENCTFRKLRHSMMIKQGANGNVFGYNYSRETMRTEFPSNASGDISGHGHYPFANLFEGNICQNIAIDQSWGPSGPRNVYFRNRAELYGLIISSGTVQSDSQAFIGNTISGTAPFTGLYILAGTGHVLHGNTVQGTVQPAGTGTLPDASLYHPSMPAYWNITAAWPSIGTGSSGAETIPAKDRFLAGSPAAFCGSASTGQQEQKQGTSLLQAWYAEGWLEVSGKGRGTVSVYDMTGKKICGFVVTGPNRRFPVLLNSGIYLVRLEGKDGLSGTRIPVN